MSNSKSRTRVKICGVTTPADAVYAAECGADAIGLNFYEKSPRFLSYRDAIPVVKAIPVFTTSIGVFVDEPLKRVRMFAKSLGLQGVQTYEKQPPDQYFAKLIHIAAFRVADQASLQEVEQYISAAKSKDCRLAAAVVDSYVVGEMGGTGQVGPWHLLAGFAPGVPIILAGGLNPDNVGAAIRMVQPWGVDVASGVESSPRRKDPGRVRAFMQAVRTAYE